MTANALSGEAVVLFWRGFNLERKANYVREFVDCEYVEWSDEQRDEIYTALHKKLRKGLLDSRVQWNGYHVEKIQGLVAEFVKDDARPTAAAKLHIEFRRPSSDATPSPSAARPGGAQVRSVGCGTSASVHNLRMQIERQKTESRMRLNGDLDEEPEVFKWSKRR